MRSEDLIYGASVCMAYAVVAVAALGMVCVTVVLVAWLKERKGER
jgi:hypothetical protein